MQIRSLLAMTVAAAVVACSNGGGDSGPVAPTPPAANTVTLGGTAAKGLLANADVAVLPVNGDGTIGATPLATGVTGTDGRYSLVFTATAGQPYVVRVTAKAGTTHLDEVTGAAEPLPAGFTLRAMLTPAGSGPVTVTTNVTPFSELAVAAAARASGGLTAANVAQATSTVRQLLGFDPTTVAVTGVGAATTADEQKLALLLTAVTKMAADGDLGCTAGAAGDKVKCVVDMLGNASRIDSLKLAVGSGAGEQDVSAALAAAISDVVADPALSGRVGSTVMATVMANLACTTNCAAGGTGGPGSVATAIAGAKLMFNEIRTDWAMMFSRGGTAPTARGAFNKEAAAFEKAMTSVQPPVEMMAKDVATLLIGVDLYNDYQAGRTSSPHRNQGYGEFIDSFGVNPATVSAVGCTLYTDATTTVVATSPANALVIGCRALYFIERSFQPGSNVTREWRHGFTIEPKSDGSFDYTTRARRRDTTCSASGCTTTANVALQTDTGGQPLPAFAGKLTPTLSVSPFGEIRSFRLEGELPAAFDDGGRALVNFKHKIALDGAETVAADENRSISVAGNLVAYRDATTVEGTLTLKNGELKTLPPEGDPAEANLDIVWNTGGSEFEGLIALTDSALDKNGMRRAPTKARLSGVFRNTQGGTSVEFARGTLTAEIVGYDKLDTTHQDLSATNSATVKLTLQAVVTTANRPALEVTLGTTADAFVLQEGGGPAPVQVQLQYRTLVAGQPRQVVAVSAQLSKAPTVFRLSEATSNISLAWTEGDARVDVIYNNTTLIGTIDTRTWLLTFSDGTFVSLDTGL
jgi:hypothetical protein